MRWLTLWLTCCVASLAVAAPAPLPRRSVGKGPWLDGWGRPMDPVGGSVFARQGGSLTITAPGSGSVLANAREEIGAPRLMRRVRGDFDLTVRVTTEGKPPTDGKQGAGLLLVSGESRALVQVVREGGAFSYCGSCWTQGGGEGWGTGGGREQKEIWLRMRRRGETVETAASKDGKQWQFHPFGRQATLGDEVEVGVFAEASSKGEFVARFDGLAFEGAR